MKFAKKLQDELYSEWCDGYIDYKMMKKVLKQENDEAVSLFCGALEEQLHKCHSFMMGQQRTISDEIVTLEFQVGLNDLCCSSNDSTIRLSGHCSRLVDRIERFRHFALLNHMAIRKIIKKFDKRFQMHFLQSIGLPDTTKLLVSDRDVGKWLLDPAQHILGLMQELVQVRNGRTSVERPLRQFNFWVSELRMGAQRARQRVRYGEMPDPTTLRLRLVSGEIIADDELLVADRSRFCVRNTFIDGCAEQRGRAGPQRAASLPPRRAAIVAAAVEEEEEEESEPSSAGSSPPGWPYPRWRGFSFVSSASSGDFPLFSAAAVGGLGEQQHQQHAHPPQASRLRGHSEESVLYVSTQGSEGPREVSAEPPVDRATTKDAQPLYISSLLGHDFEEPEDEAFGGSLPSGGAGFPGVANARAFQASLGKAQAQHGLPHWQGLRPETSGPPGYDREPGCDGHFPQFGYDRAPGAGRPSRPERT
eukprot:CAMPEP_0203973132 /NCGR_PEP_ID=MMETSP0359-20131031/99430_1 /ASSEMBLY_ACC=CAM_ASM_000338 /TAXON_ID=268821 /ORGANISM="Scrippsiella Hangoei, Strain SHTV-5" /LENGTH=475 /DNA_ID=CAMNT_0050911275 /DNA_START=49 /DNA_END=1472 /DNA_ORIENTATION=-